MAAAIPATGLGATALGIIVPPLALAAGGVAIAADGPSFVVNLFEAVTDDRARDRLRLSLEQKKAAAIGTLAGLTGVEKTPLVDAVAEVSNRAAAQLLV